jgi:hypothetical protein
MPAMLAKTFACASGLLLLATAAPAQRPPSYFDRAAYVTCREADAMSPDVRTTLMSYLTQHAAQVRGVMVPNDDRNTEIAGLVRGGCTLSPDAHLYTIIDRAILTERSRLPRR